MKLISLFRRGISPVLLSFFSVAFFVGIAGSLQFPTLSRFLTDEVTTPGLVSYLAEFVNAKSFWVGLFYSVSAVAAMTISFLLARYSDRMKERKRLIIFCCLMSLSNSILFAFSRNYFLLITLGVMLSALANSTSPQLFALLREYSERSAHNIALFSSIMRAQISLAWVIGPPVSFILASRYGFTTMYLSAAAVFVLAAIVVHFFLPTVTKIATPSEQTMVTQIPITKDKDVIRLFFSMVLIFACNMMYLIDMPIYTDKELGLSKDLAGYLMGTAAGLEIPFMVMAGYYVKNFSKHKMVLFAIAAAGCFYLGLICFKSQIVLIFLQIFNAIFIGIVAGIGMLYFQDLMPGRAGIATTLFSNSGSMGIILAGVLQGALSGTLGHYAVYWTALVLTIFAFILCLGVRDV